MSSPTQKPQQWELLASPGHVLFARVNAVRGKLTLAKVGFAIGGVLLVVAAFAGPMLEAGVSKAANWIANIGAGSSGGAAPALRSVNPRMPMLDLGRTKALTSVTELTTWITSSQSRLAAGQQPEHCQSSKITDTWFVGDGTLPQCRAAKDGSRVWAWGVFRQGHPDYPFPMAFAVAFHKERSGWVAYSVRDSGTALPGLPTLELRAVPRGVAADFPELIVRN